MTTTKKIKLFTKHSSHRQLPSHDHDFYAWAMETAKALRKRYFKYIDWDSIAEEIEDMGRSEKRALRNHIAILMTHLLKWIYQPELTPNKSWALTIKEQRRQIDQLLQDNPSLKSHLPEISVLAYEDAVLKAAKETDFEEEYFPQTAPWSFETIMDTAFPFSGISRTKAPGD
jgi:hypothetical protein